MERPQGQGDFDALARQYWTAWGDLWRAGMPAGGMPGMGANAAQGGPAREWYAAMQQVAAQFAGQQATPHDITRAWKQALGAAGENPFPEMFRAMRGQGQQGLDQWTENVAPMLDAWKREAGAWLGMPAFGFAREHQERWQKLAQAQVDYQQQTGAYNALMWQAAQRAYEVFETKLAERSEPGRQLGSARALFDLWIDAAEEAYAEIALSEQFRLVYGRLVDAQMRVRGGLQREVEQATGAFGMPTRSEMDAAHRKITQLEREVRKLRDALLEGANMNATKASSKPAATSTAERPGEPSLKVQGDKILGPGKGTGEKRTGDGKPAKPKKKGKGA